MDKVDPKDPKLKRANLRTAWLLGAVAIGFFGFFIWYMMQRAA